MRYVISSVSISDFCIRLLVVLQYCIAKKGIFKRISKHRAFCALEGARLAW